MSKEIPVELPARASAHGMANPMKGCIIHAPHVATLLLFALSISTAAAGDPAVERDALAALRRALRSRLLDESWVGLPCVLPEFSSWFGIRCAGGHVMSVALEELGLSGRLEPNALANLTDLVLLSLRRNSISGDMMDFSSNPGMNSVDLSENMFSGSISESLLRLPHLSSLQLHNNYFTGSIPPFSQANLTAFNVSYNNLTGEIPATQTLLSLDSSSYQGNPGLCGPPTTAACSRPRPPAPHISMDHLVPSPGPQHKERNKLIKSPLLMAFGAVCLIALVVLLALLYDFHKRSKTTEDAKERWAAAGDEGTCSEIKEGEVNGTTRQDGGGLVLMEGVVGIDVRDLLRSSAEDLGRGSFGGCYKAMLQGERVVVVKRLREVKPLTSEEFERKVGVLGRMRHPNLLPLLGFYHSGQEKLLIHNYAPHGNLFDRIHGGRGANRVPFRWNSRLQVAQGVARAMEFLHRRCEESDVVPHGNLKATNVLLGENDTVLVSDYGLATLIAPSVAVQRMMAYKSPEYENLRRVSMKSDVWSYGCLLLELVTGRVPHHSAPRGVRGVELYSWVRRAVREEWTGEVFDSEVTGGQKSSTDGMVKLLQVAVRCCNWQPEKRPEMEEVLRDLEGMKSDTSEEEEADNSSDRSSAEGRINTSSR